MGFTVDNIPKKMKFGSLKCDPIWTFYVVIHAQNFKVILK